MPALSPSLISCAWKVLLIFLIPVGGGIPAGVVIAQKGGLGWPLMEILYFISDVILACVFEPLMLLVIAGAKRSAWVSRIREAFRKSTQKTAARYGTKLGPFSLIMIAFGIDPMTGRSAAAAAGHGFVSGWTLAITGDMLFFTILMVSTIWLNGILGDGTWTTVIMLVAMMVVPYLVRRCREWFSSRSLFRLTKNG